MRSNERPNPVTVCLGLKTFRGHSRGVSKALNNAVKLEVLSFEVTPFEGEATLTDVVNELRNLKAAMDRNTIFTAIPAIHVSDEMTRLGWMAKNINERLDDQVEQSEADPDIAGDGESAEEEETEAPAEGAGTEIPF